MTKEEIALQLTLAKLDCLQFTTYAAAASDTNTEFNKKLGEEIANIYNNVYNNLDCYKNTSAKLEDLINDVKTF